MSETELAVRKAEPKHWTFRNLDWTMTLQTNVKYLLGFSYEKIRGRETKKKKGVFDGISNPLTKIYNKH